MTKKRKKNAESNTFNVTFENVDGRSSRPEMEGDGEVGRQTATARREGGEIEENASGRDTTSSRFECSIDFLFIKNILFYK